MMKEDS